MKVSEYYYNELIKLGATPDQARMVLTNSTKAEIVMTANNMELLHFFDMRTAPGVHPTVRAIALHYLKNRLENDYEMFKSLEDRVTDKILKEFDLYVDN